MNVKSRHFKVVDILLLTGAILPLLAAIVLKVLTTPLSEGIEITGARIFFTIPMPLQDLPITEAQVNSVAVILTILFGFWPMPILDMTSTAVNAVVARTDSVAQVVKTASLLLSF